MAVVLEEKPITKAKTSKGLRVEAKFNEVTYELECGHVVTRQHPRLEPTREPGHSIRCEHCSAAASEASRASA